MAELRLSNGSVALVDDDEFARIAHLPWRAQPNPRGTYVFFDRREGGKTTRTFLHRLLMGNPKGVEVDHVNGDPLDNRRCNLRIATRMQNTWNRRRRNGLSASGFVGVTRKMINGRERWEARLQANGRKFYALCTTAAEAALKRDEFAREHHGEFAVLNFPEDLA